jgi:succinate dehydrogenase/fumarate reductase cytochrome b subunit
MAGLVVALFLFLHLTIAAIGAHPVAFMAVVDWIHGSFATPFAACLVLLLFASQALTGLLLTATGGAPSNCDRGGPNRFRAQRITGIAILAFVVAHLVLLHGGRLEAVLGNTLVRPDSASGGHNILAATRAFAAIAAAFGPGTLLMALSLFAIWATAFHVGNGAWLGARLWHLFAPHPQRRRWSRICTAIGFALALLGTTGWYAFTLSPTARASLAMRSE